jgi:hypothetical protein
MTLVWVRWRPGPPHPEAAVPAGSRPPVAEPAFGEIHAAPQDVALALLLARTCLEAYGVPKEIPRDARQGPSPRQLDGQRTLDGVGDETGPLTSGPVARLAPRPGDGRFRGSKERRPP